MCLLFRSGFEFELVFSLQSFDGFRLNFSIEEDEPVNVHPYPRVQPYPTASGEGNIFFHDVMT